MKILKRAVLFLLILVLAIIVSYVWRAAPILTGYGAKDLCSCVFVANRDAADVIANELGRSPLSLGSFTIDINDSSASASLFGFARKKAVYRKGLGCTLISGLTEEELRAQKFHSTSANSFLPTDTVAWPAGDKVTGAIPASVNFEKLNQTLENAFNEPGEKKLRPHPRGRRSIRWAYHCRKICSWILCKIKTPWMVDDQKSNQCHGGLARETRETFR